MSHLMRRSVRIGKYTIPALLLVALVIGTVAATVYVVLTFTAQVTVQANPKVCFYKWADDTAQNTFTETFNIFPSVQTVNTNATHGIFCNDTVAHTCYLRIYEITTPANIDEVYIKVYNDTATVVEKTWTSPSPPTGWESFTAAAGAKYTIQMNVTADAGASGSSDIAFEMKVENP